MLKSENRPDYKLFKSNVTNKYILAVEKDNIDVVNILLQNGANPNLVSGVLTCHRQVNAIHLFIRL
ncbi:ankyrin repeat domain-containing protein [Wolbachia pipientis]|uniref:ankyrin repeat domain-containing protein n=1 Tax=Wolbachia pipientis TaxID=955 RepID=UPI001C9A1688|nr:ankyrin repeat domain-containing protein [Wolbachia pipientis]